MAQPIRTTDYLKTDNENLRIQFPIEADNTIVPGGSAELPIEDCTDGKGGTEFTTAPVNTTGHVPHTGEYRPPPRAGQIR